MNIQKILAPTDFSESSEAAVRYALDLAKKMDARVTLLHVYFIPVYPVGPDGGAFIPGPEAVTETLLYADSELDKFKTRVFRSDVPIDCRTTEGPAREAIVRFARDEAFDLIVMGTHGRTGLRHLFLGSVAESVVRMATIPVLTVRNPVEVHPALFSAPAIP